MSDLAAPRPGYFAVLALPRAYTTLLYLLLSLPLGIFAFTFAVTGLSLSLGLAVLIVGIPFVLGFLALTRVLAVAESTLLRSLVDPGAPATPALLPEGGDWSDRVRSLITDRRTWTSLAYFLLLLPLGVAYSVLVVTSLALTLGLLAAPFLGLFQGLPEVSIPGFVWASSHPMAILLVCGLVGALLLPLTLHLGVALGRFQGWLARQLLVRV